MHIARPLLIPLVAALVVATAPAVAAVLIIDTRPIGGPASHGCVRLAPANAAKLYALVEVHGLTNAKVVLTGDVCAALARRLTRVRNPEEAVVSQTRSLPTALGLRPTISRLDD